ncbi:VOC family protein [Paenibacillus terricola]|uniref:VOC family protein n=1 Tax=Paenibacillus terricola TaxID=2763503 RepID=UPI00296451B3|nr:VOC family protein [Paenibacillus terricola]
MEIVKARIENSLTVLLVSDLARSQAYYSEAFGCDVNDFWAIRDDFALGFKLIQAESIEDVRPNRNHWNTYAYVRTHGELDTLFEELKSNGANIAAEPVEIEFDWGVWKEFSVKDPDGYVIGFGSGNKNSD